MHSSPQETLAALERVGYFTDLTTATTVYLAGKIHRPIMLEGPAGAGKTELAQSVARAYEVPLLRLQCYQGINEEKAIGQYDKNLRELYILLMSKSAETPDWGEIKREVTSRSYFMAGPLLEAIEREKPCVLLIDEIDKVDYFFEARHLSAHARALAWGATSTTSVRCGWKSTNTSSPENFRIYLPGLCRQPSARARNRVRPLKGLKGSVPQCRKVRLMQP
jgi:hypothetical protein